MTQNVNFRLRLMTALHEFADLPALEVEDQTYSYKTLLEAAEPLSACIHTHENGAYVGILGARAFAVYQGIISIVLAGKAYVPLNPKFPIQRLCLIAEEAPFKTLIVCPEAEAVFEELAPHLGGLTIIWLNPESDLDKISQNYPDLTFVRPPPSGAFPKFETRVDRAAYLLFTSGTTGKPKKVMISDQNLSAYLVGFQPLCQITPKDRHSQFFELSFDVSVHDLFMCWVHGACLVVVPQKDVMAPAKFIQNREITVWFSVPATASMMQKFGLLKPDSLPSLRLSMFIGEALPASLIEPWQNSAPNSALWNVYGPTEATIACLQFDCADLPYNKYDVVPIGQPFGDTLCRQTDQGELLVSGAQVCAGYLDNPEKTDAAFITDEAGVRWYHTGDVVKQETSGTYAYLGRLDDQVQIHGFRVELGEIDGAVSKAVGHPLVCCVVKQSQTIEAYVEGKDDIGLRKCIFEICKDTLPDYMVPKKITFIDHMPLNPNGKIDRKALKQTEN